MDITIKCPECENEFTASDITETAPCSECGATVNTKDNKKSRFSLKKKPGGDQPPATEGAAKKDESDDKESEPSSNPADVIRKLQGQHANRTMMPVNQPPPSGDREPEDSDYTSDDIVKMERRARRKLITGRVVGVIVGFIIPLIAINGLYYYAENYNPSAHEWVLFPTLGLICFGGIGLCISSIMSSFKDFFIAACLPILGIGFMMSNPLAGLGISLFSSFYTIYFIIMKAKSFTFKGYYFGLQAALALLVFQTAEPTAIQTYFDPVVEEIRRLLSK